MENETVKQLLVDSLKILKTSNDLNIQAIHEFVDTFINFGYENEIVKFNPQLVGALITLIVQRYAYNLLTYLKENQLSIEDYLKVFPSPEPNIMKAVNITLRQFQENKEPKSKPPMN